MAHDLAAFKAYFVRDFSYGSTTDTVMDADVQKALDQVPLVFNDALWISGSELDIAFLYAAAHYLVLDLQAAGGLSLVNLSQGANSRGSGPINNTSVGSVSIGFALPESMTNNPILYSFMQTNYGQKYLQFLTPRLVGNMAVVSGWTDPGTDGAI